MKIRQHVAWLVAVVMCGWLALGTAAWAADAKAGAAKEDASTKELKKKYPGLLRGIEDLKRLKEKMAKASKGQEAGLKKQEEERMKRWYKDYDLVLKRVEDKRDKLNDEIGKMNDKVQELKNKKGSSAALEKQVEAKQKQLEALEAEVTLVKTLPGMMGEGKE